MRTVTFISGVPGCFTEEDLMDCRQEIESIIDRYLPESSCLVQASWSEEGEGDFFEVTALVRYYTGADESAEADIAQAMEQLPDMWQVDIEAVDEPDFTPVVGEIPADAPF